MRKPYLLISNVPDFLIETSVLLCTSCACLVYPATAGRTATRVYPARAARLWFHERCCKRNVLKQSVHIDRFVLDAIGFCSTRLGAVDRERVRRPAKASYDVIVLGEQYILHTGYAWEEIYIIRKCAQKGYIRYIAKV